MILYPSMLASCDCHHLLRPSRCPYRTQRLHVTRTARSRSAEGDNAETSIDSNDYGFMPEANVESKVVAKLWPLHDIGLVVRREAGPEKCLRVDAPATTRAAVGAAKVQHGATRLLRRFSSGEKGAEASAS